MFVVCFLLAHMIQLISLECDELQITVSEKFIDMFTLLV